MEFPTGAVYGAFARDTLFFPRLLIPTTMKKKNRPNNLRQRHTRRWTALGEWIERYGHAYLRMHAQWAQNGQPMPPPYRDPMDVY